MAGGLNLYGYANGDPVNFSDPFGLCVDDDKICEATVAILRQVAEGGGEGADIFATAADALDEWKDGRVQWVRSDEPPLGPSSFGTVYGMAPGAYNNPTGDIYIAIDQKSGDFVMTALHEVLHLDSMLGGGHDAEFRRTCRAGYRALPAVLQDPNSSIGAPGHARSANRQGC